MQLRVWFFGGIRVQISPLETPKRPGGQRAVALLAYLALHPLRSHSRELLAARLWPELPADSARHRLRQTLAELRGSCGEEAVLSEGRDYLRLAPSHTEREDLQAALQRGSRDALEKALAFCQGDPLEELYDDWALSFREELERLRQQARDALMNLPTAPTPSPVSSSLLPTPLSRLLGRQSELEYLTGILQGSTERLVTLLGVGGIGKTRLALAIARHWPGQAFFVPLASLQESPRLLEAILEQLPGQEGCSTSNPLLELREFFLTHQQPLLVLDNLEQLPMEDISKTLRNLLECVGHLACLVTSRVPIGIPGEREFPLLPLAEEASESLFLERVYAVRPDFALTPANHATVQAICARLEGVPLALELAAARMRALSPSQILEQLERPLEFLVRTRPGGERRHSSLRTAIAWSYELLSEQERQVFRALSIFRGGFTLEAARTVLGRPDTLELLERLRDHSLLIVREGEEETRYDLLETLREFAQEQLTLPEREALAQAHASYYVMWGQQVGSRLIGAHQRLNLSRMDRERPNLFLAYEGLAGPNREERQLSWGDCMGEYLFVRGEYPELLLRLEPVLEKLAPRIEEADERLAYQWVRRAGGLGTILRNMGEIQRSRQWFLRALDVAKKRNIEELMGFNSLYLGVLHRVLGELEEAEALGTLAIRILENLPVGFRLGAARGHLAETLMAQGRLEEAKVLLDAAQQAHSFISNERGVYEVLHRRAYLAFCQGNQRAGGEILCQVGPYFLNLRDFGNVPHVIESWIRYFGEKEPLAWILGYLERPGCYLMSKGSPSVQRWWKELSVQGSEQLGADAWKCAYDEGAQLSPTLLLSRLERLYELDTQKTLGPADPSVLSS